MTENNDDILHITSMKEFYTKAQSGRGEGMIADNSSLSVLGAGVEGEDCWHVGPGFPF
jgi:hypothetical protein